MLSQQIHGKPAVAAARVTPRAVPQAAPLRRLGNPDGSGDGRARPLVAVRAATAADAADIARLQGGPASAAPLPDGLGRADHDYLVMTDCASGACIGYALAQLRRFRLGPDPAAPLLGQVQGGRDAELHITALLVASPFRRRGLGRLLLDTLLERCRAQHPQCRSALVMIGRGHVAARRLIASRRFLVVDCVGDRLAGQPSGSLLLRRYFGTVG